MFGGWRDVGVFREPCLAGGEGPVYIASLKVGRCTIEKGGFRGSWAGGGGVLGKGVCREGGGEGLGGKARGEAWLGKRGLVGLG